MDFAPPRGMRDFYPEEMRVRNMIFDAWKKAARLYGFEEYDAPVVESEELLTRKSGEEIIDQIYHFTDKSDRRLALRPEMTPSLARMVISRQKMLTYPLKWFCTPQCFRYERMTKGRKREHFQWNLDIVGEESIMAEAEVLGAAITALKFMGLTSNDFKVRIGSRRLLADLFQATGLAETHFLPTCLVLDKMGKITETEIKQMLLTEKLTEDEISKVLELMQIRSLPQAMTLLKSTPKSILDVQELFSIMAAAGLGDFLEFDISIIRGLDYYTGIVFEAFDTERQFRAIFGGGRYDNLLSSLGGDKMTSIGLGFGDVVVRELLDAKGKINLQTANDGVIIGYMELAQREIGLKIAMSLRNQGLDVNLSLVPEKPKKFFSKGDKLKIRYSIYIGPDEVNSGTFTIKNMVTGTEKNYAYGQLVQGRLIDLN
ncbi:histidine--tRNA ligase [candidate division KSB1 bacterium]|nr:histidine--tRNA ligase [candidate division KSB1 bacterium]